MRESLKCPFCDYETQRQKQSVQLEAHLASQHDRSLIDAYVTAFLGGQRPICGCGCGKETTWVGWKNGFAKFQVGHNPPWTKGRTKENDPRTAEAAVKTSQTRKARIASGEIQIWSKGKTKETDERIAAFSETIKNEFQTGNRVAWHKGLTAETDERVAKAARKQKTLWQSGEISQWHKGKTKKELPQLVRSENSKQAQSERLKFTWEEVLMKLSSLAYTKIISRPEEYIGSHDKCLRLQCLECNSIEIKTLYTAQTDRCDTCNPLSAAEREWLDSLGIPQECRNRWIFIGNSRYNVDALINSTIYEFYGDYWHGHPRFPRDKINHMNKMTMAELYQRTINRESQLRAAGYVVITMWESDWAELRKTRRNHA